MNASGMSGSASIGPISAIGLMPVLAPYPISSSAPWREQEVERRLAETSVRRDGSVVADRPIDHGNPRGEHQHDEYEVAADEPGDDAEAGDDAGKAGPVAHAAVREIQGDGCRTGRPQQCHQQVGPPCPPRVLTSTIDPRSAYIARRERGAERSVSCHEISVCTVPLRRP